MAERPTAAMDHARHDLELIARAAAGDGSATDVRAAAALRDACPECRSLDTDLRAIAAGVRELRGAEAQSPARDFRLSPADAARLRRRSLGGLLGGQGAAGSRGMGRFGGGLVAIGLVGLLFGSGFLSAFSGLGLGGSAALPAAAPAATATAPGYAASGQDNASEGLVLGPVPTLGVVAQPAPSSAATSVAGLPLTSATSATGRTSAPDKAAPTAGPLEVGEESGTSVPGSPGSPVIYVSIAALVVGIGLLVASRTGRRAGP